MKKYCFVPVLFLSVIVSCSVSRNTKKIKLAWEENFDQNTSFDTSRWSKIPRGNSDWNRHMSNFDSLYAIRDGKLVLRGIRNTTQLQDTAPFITGGVYTKGKVDFGFGRVEIRAKLGTATGAWPAFWMLAEGTGWPDGGEIDIMEHLNYDSIVYQTVHSYYTVTLNEKKNPRQGGIASIHPNEFNIYAVEKYNDSLVFYVNDARTFAYPRINTDKPGQFPFADEQYYLLLDMQLGGSWVGEVNTSELPVEMEIDWVRFYTFPNQHNRPLKN